MLKNCHGSYLAENHLVCNLEGELGPVAPAQLRLVVLQPCLLCPASKGLLEPSVRLPNLNSRVLYFLLFSIFDPNLNHLLLNLLPHPGHPEEHGGQSLLQGGDQGALQRVPVGKVHRAEALGGHEQVHDVGRHVGEGQVGDEPLLQVEEAVVRAERSENSILC